MKYFESCLQEPNLLQLYFGAKMLDLLLLNWIRAQFVSTMLTWPQTASVLLPASFWPSPTESIVSWSLDSKDLESF